MITYAETFLDIVLKVWGAELWLVNEKEYCCKFLEFKKGASGSLHYHPIKKETFKVLNGKCMLEVGDKTYKLSVISKPITINPGTPHRVKALKDTMILEVSTHHDDNDVVRIEVSKVDNK